MADIKGLQAVKESLARHAEQYGPDRVDVVVGYTQAYALYVHENLEARHPVGQAKYLEQPARQLNNDGTLGSIVVAGLKRGLTLGKALLLAGLRLQRESQLLCPVDTGALKGSAFTRLEEG